MADRCEVLAAFLLGATDMLPAIEILAARHDDDLGPAGVAIEAGLFLDLRHLRGPEIIGTGKIAILAEQVGNDLAGVVCDIEHRDLGRNRAADRKSTRLNSSH